MQLMSFQLQINSRQAPRVSQTRAARYCALSRQQLERLASLLITKQIGNTLHRKLLDTTAPYIPNV